MKYKSLVLALAILLTFNSVGAWAAGSYHLGADDVVRVTVYGHPDLDTVARIAENGSITFPTVGEVSLAGLTARQAEHKLAEILAKADVVKSPIVGLIVDQFQSQQVAVLGKVAKPGMYVITRESTLTDLITQAGGLSEDAGDTAILTRSSSSPDTKTVVDLTSLLEGRASVPEPKVRNGDRIYVPEMEKFYVYGEVNKPGAYRLERGMTVVQALSVAGGLTDKATERGMKIRRLTSNGSEEIIPAELTHALRPSDVLYVEESLF